MELHNILSSDQYDIILVTETWLKDKYLNGEIVGSNSNYSVAARMDRSDKIGGGTLAIVKNKHSFMQIQLKEKYKDLELACFDLIGEDNKIRFIVCYRPPSFDQEAKTMLKKKEKKEKRKKGKKREKENMGGACIITVKLNWNILAAAPRCTYNLTFWRPYLFWRESVVRLYVLLHRAPKCIKTLYILAPLLRKSTYTNLSNLITYRFGTSFIIHFGAPMHQKHV